MRHLLACLAFLTLAALASAAPSHPLAGRWVIDPARSTELSPWRSIELTLSVEGDIVRLHRHFSAGRRTFDEHAELDLSRPVNLVPVAWWPDNRHLGAYISGDKQKRVHARWLDDGRILRLSSDLILSTSQGDRAVNVLSDFKVSANGALLTVTELRSTRNQPVVHTFTRADSARP